MKMRDDHDSSKKKGQIQNFKNKLAYLKEGKTALKGFMYFVDPEIRKNKKYYEEELKTLEETKGVTVRICYGEELFEHLGFPEKWKEIISHLEQWKKNLPDLPEVNFDCDAERSYEELKRIKPRIWLKLLEEDRLWEYGIIKVMFRDGSTLRRLLNHFQERKSISDEQEAEEYRKVYETLKQRLEEHYKQ